MKKTLFLLIFIAVLGLLTVGCQQDEDKVTQNPQNLNKISELTKLLRRVSASDAGDNTIDGTACFSIKMPYTVWVYTVEGNNMTSYGAEVNDVNSLEEVKATINSLDDDDYFRLQFPVTIVYNDGSEAVANSAAELNSYKSQCETDNPVNSVIPCLSINYPITVYSYNSSFQLANTYQFNNDTELLTFLQNLDFDEYYALDFPIQVHVNDILFDIANNQQLTTAIQAAMNDCSPVVNPCNNPDILVDDLVIYMPFANEARDLVTMTDAVHNDNYPPVFVADRDGNANSAVTFSGADLDYLKLLASDANNIENGPISISLWFKANNTNESDLEHLFEKSNGGQNNSLNFGLALYDLNRPLFYANQDPIFNLWDGSWDMQADNPGWHHLVVTVDDGFPSAEVKLYRDGVFIGSAQSPDPIFINTQFFDYYMGRKFKGSLDDIRVYRKKLTSGEVKTLFNLEGDNNTCVN